jgi:hypothetical protein
MKSLIPSDWSSSTKFNDENWISAIGTPRTANAYMWGDVEARLAAIAGVSNVRMAWAPNSDIPYIKNLARLVVIPPACGKLRALPLFFLYCKMLIASLSFPDSRAGHRHSRSRRSVELEL